MVRDMGQQCTFVAVLSDATILKFVTPFNYMQEALRQSIDWLVPHECSAYNLVGLPLLWTGVR